MVMAIYLFNPNYNFGIKLQNITVTIKNYEVSGQMLTGLKGGEKSYAYSKASKNSSWGND